MQEQRILGKDVLRRVIRDMPFSIKYQPALQC